MNEILKRKPTFFTSDWHIGHENSIKFDNRPFKNLDEMHKILIKKYNNIVPENGICYFLGDIATCSTELCKSILDQLNGVKVCVVGNHDKAYAAMYNCGFDVVLNSASLKIANQIVTISHCPLPGIFREDTSGMQGATGLENWHGENKNTDFTVPNVGQFHIHGHIHSPNGGKSVKILNRQYDVGVPNSGYKPVSISEIESWIATTLQTEKQV